MDPSHLAIPASSLELDCDVLVTEFSCRDHSVLTSLDESSIELRWQLYVGFNTEPLEIMVHLHGTDSSTGTKVSVMTAHGFQMKRLFPKNRPANGSNGSSLKDSDSFSATLTEDFVHRWSFMGRAPGLTVPQFYQFSSPMLSSSPEWLDATIMKQWPDGSFEIVALLPEADGSKVRRVAFSEVLKEDLREKATQKPLELPTRQLELRLPAANPLRGAALVLDGKDDLTHRFVRLSPPPEVPNARQGKNLIRLQVTKDRRLVSCTESVAILKSFLAGEVRRGIQCPPSAKAHFWVLHIGPFCRHKIEVETRSDTVASVRVDETHFVEAESESLGSPPGTFHCHFSLLGERSLQFQVFETNVDGHSLDDTSAAFHVSRYVCECDVHLKSLAAEQIGATLFVNGVEFNDLPPVQTPEHDEGFVIHPESFKKEYNVAVPYKVNLEADTEFEQFFTKRIIGLGEGEPAEGGLGLFGIFNIFCCRRSSQEAAPQEDANVDATSSMADQQPLPKPA